MPTHRTCVAALLTMMLATPSAFAGSALFDRAGQVLEGLRALSTSAGETLRETCGIRPGVTYVRSHSDLWAVNPGDILAAPEHFVGKYARVQGTLITGIGPDRRDALLSSRRGTLRVANWYSKRFWGYETGFDFQTIYNIATIVRRDATGSLYLEPVTNPHFYESLITQD